ncbi:MAG: hypothetical protein IJ666_03855 [Ruminococcus sp.]|nr:hypothetical protein [Ruminococcus sp.]
MKKYALVAALALMLTGCGEQTALDFDAETVTEEEAAPEIMEEVPAPEAAEEVTVSEDEETKTETVSKTTETEKEPPCSEKNQISIETNLETEGASFVIGNTDGYFERFNDYTGEMKYSFEIDTVTVDETLYAYLENSNLSLSCSGKKLYDCLGDDVPRRVAVVMDIKDSDGNIIESKEMWTEDVKTGEEFDEFYIPSYFNFTVKPEQYTIDIHAKSSDTVVRAEGSEYLNPERWYTAAIIKKQLEEDAELPFDTSEQWLADYSVKEIYIDENLMLHGLFPEPYDLHNAKFDEGSETQSEVLLSDLQYGKTVYYDIEEPEKYLKDIPEEAIPVQYAFQ